MSFTLDVAKFVEKAKRNNDTVMRQVSIKLFSAIIQSSPVDTGQFRMNWQASNSAPAGGVVGGYDKSGSMAIGNMTKFIESSASANEFTLANNLPYAAVIEYGGYPNPVKLGSWNKSKQAYEIKSQGGYSKQAPQGVVRVNVARFNALLDEEAAKVR